MLSKDLKNFINTEKFKETISDLYGTKNPIKIENHIKRFNDILDRAVKLYGDGDYHFISSPGRVEVGGNHTDHQCGNVVAASIDLDNLAVVKPNDKNIIRFCDDVFKMNEVDLSDLNIHSEEKGNTKSILRGVASKIKELGFNIGGFDAFQDMKVLVGSGLSSSACFEVLITEIFNSLYNDEKINVVERAKLSQNVENEYFGKPCGLMDQTAISVGSFVSIDFADKKNPIIKKHDFNFLDYGYNFVIINTKGDHMDLTDEYSAIPNEMKLVANYFNKDVLNEVDSNIFYKEIFSIRKSIKNDRAILRAHHFFMENERAKYLSKALENKDIKRVLEIMEDSGNSSYMYLQNVYPISDIKNQSVALSIAMCKKFIKNNGVCRVQGGGFAGTIQAVVKSEIIKDFISEVNSIYGENSVTIVKIRKYGTKFII